MVLVVLTRWHVVSMLPMVPVRLVMDPVMEALLPSLDVALRTVGSRAVPLTELDRRAAHEFMHVLTQLLNVRLRVPECMVTARPVSVPLPLSSRLSRVTSPWPCRELMPARLLIKAAVCPARLGSDRRMPFLIVVTDSESTAKRPVAMQVPKARLLFGPLIVVIRAEAPLDEMSMLLLVAMLSLMCLGTAKVMTGARPVAMLGPAVRRVTCTLTTLEVLEMLEMSMLGLPRAKEVDTPYGNVIMFPGMCPDAEDLSPARKRWFGPLTEAQVSTMLLRDVLVVHRLPRRKVDTVLPMLIVVMGVVATMVIVTVVVSGCWVLDGWPVAVRCTLDSLTVTEIIP